MNAPSKKLPSNRLLNRFEAEIGLLISALLWGLTFPLIRSAVRTVDPYVFVALRFVIPTLVALPIIFFIPALRKQVRLLWRQGILMGGVTAACFITQTVGLKTISSPRSAFITGMYVLFVPMLSPFFENRWPTPLDWVGALMATAGLYCLLSPDSTSPITLADWLTLLCAFCCAVQMHLVQRITRRYPDLHPFALAFLQVAGVAVFSFLTAGIFGKIDLPASTLAWSWLLVCALVVTLGTLFLQARYQKETTPERAAIIFAFEPVFACFFGYWILREVLTAEGIFGGILILGALLLTEVGPRFRRKGRRMETPSFTNK